MLGHGEAHLWTAGFYYIIGLVLIGLAFSVWWTHPVNRVFIFGRYLTQDGMRLVMMSWPMVLLFGAFIFSCAVDHHVEYLHSHGRPRLRSAVVFFSIVEAVISGITAIVILALGGRALWRLLCRK
jgi:hypothetical protein